MELSIDAKILHNIGFIYGDIINDNIITLINLINI